MASNIGYKRQMIVLNVLSRWDDEPITAPGKTPYIFCDVEYKKPGIRGRRRARFFIKAVRTKSHANNEVLANHMYLMLGIECCLGYRVLAINDQLPKLFPYLTKSSRHLVAYRIVGNLTPVVQAASAYHLPDVIKGFVADCFFANWDGGKCGRRANLFFTNSGTRVTRLNFGGSLLYRALGAPKGLAFGCEVAEMSTLREQAIYSQVPDEDIFPLIDRLLEVFTEDVIRDLVNVYDLGSTNLAETLIARRADLQHRRLNCNF